MENLKKLEDFLENHIIENQNSKIKKSKIENQKSKSSPTHFGHSIDMSKYNINRLDRVYFIDILLYFTMTIPARATSLRQGVFLGLNPQIWGNENFGAKSADVTFFL